MARIIVKLADFDQEPIIEYAITERELVNIYQYVQAMQSHLTQGTWEEICEAGYYGASALIHEVVELRMLLRRDPYLLMRAEDEIKHFARQRQNRDAHCRGLETEYRYLQNIIYRLYGIWLDVGALVRANTQRYGDWDDLFETNLPFYEPALEEIEEAERWVKRLRNREGVMMKVRYRIVEERTRQNDWEIVGAITLWEADPPQLQLRGIMQHTISRSIWRLIHARVTENNLTLENFHEALGEFARDYHLQPEIHCIEGESAAEIRHILREKYVYGPLTEAVAA